MSIPLDFLRVASTPPDGTSLGDVLAERIERSSHVQTLLDCLCTTPTPALYSSDPSRPPLFHDAIHSFVTHFFMPCSTSRTPLGPNDRVVVALPTGPENALALLAIASYHTCAPVNASCTAAELREDASRLRAKAVVSTREAIERLELRELRDDLGCEVVLIDGRDSGPAGLFDMSILDGGAIRSASPSSPHRLDDQSLVLHTSGTSGKKKVVPYTLRSLIVGTWAVVQSWDLRSSDINMNMMPLFHVGGIVRNLLAPVFSGGSAIMCPGFDALAFWQLASKLKSTWYYAAPTIHHAILTSQPEGITPSRDLCIRMICNAAGGLLPSLAQELKERFHGAVILPSYGIACGPYLSIRDPSNLERELPRGKTGAVCVRGLPTFSGYEVIADVNAPLDKSAFTSEGWFDSGDCGYMDTDGYLFITGRSKEIINKGGEVISPFEIEEAIITAAKDHVKTALAFSVEHDVLQETIGVVIVSQPGRPRIGLSQLHDLIRDHLHPSKWPFAIVYMKDVPKNSAGKPLRIKLAARLGLGCLTDNVPLLRRHFQAEVPHAQASLSEPIPCKEVSVNYQDVENALQIIEGVKDVAIRTRSDGSSEAFLAVQATLDHELVSRAVGDVLPGYAIPQIHLVAKLARDTNGEFAFDEMEKEIAHQNSSNMSPQALIVKDIVAELLSIEPGTITAKSDFFMLGGNSLLLGKLSYLIRKNTGISIAVAAIFSNSTIEGIASLIEVEQRGLSLEALLEENLSTGATNSSDATLAYDPDPDFSVTRKSRRSTHPLTMLVQLIPTLFFYPLKTALTWAMLLFILSYLTPILNGDFWERMGALLCAIVTARAAARTVAPLGSIIFKWIVIGRYRPGTYPMWSTYYLRWWIVNQSILLSGKGIFALHPKLELWYYRLLGARIGNNIYIDKNARLGEFDLLTLGDGCRIDAATVRGFCVEREGSFSLRNISIGRRAVINTYTWISPGAVIPDSTVWGPHSSSFDQPLARSFGAYNRTSFVEPHWILQLLVAWPIIFVVRVASYIPWFACLWLMIDQAIVLRDGLSSLVSVIYWFAAPQRVTFHVVARVVRAVITPILHVALSILVKRLFGLNKECAAADASQITLLKRYINSHLLSKRRLKDAFSLLGNHYEIVSIVYRMMGAKIGRRVYWPGSGVYCLDPELLEIGDDVVFGSRSELFTTDRLGTAKIVIGNGAMIADRVVLLPGTRVGHRTVMGSGALGKRNAVYEDNSTWMGNDRGEAICFNKGSPNTKEDDDTTSPFGRAFYKRQANYFVYPYIFILFTNLLVAGASAAYWSISAVVAAQLLRQLFIHLSQLQLFSPHWHNFGTLYGLIGCCFVIVLSIQALLSLLWVILTKWIVIGQRRPGQYHWDKSSYCQRWQLHLVLSRPLYTGHGNGGVLAPLTGTTFIVWFYRAMGAKIGDNCVLFPAGKPGLMTEPDLVELGHDVSLDYCSVVAHINSRGQFALNSLRIGNGCAMRSGSRLLSGASMDDDSMLCEHTLLTSGEVAEAGEVYYGWPAKRMVKPKSDDCSSLNESKGVSLICPICRGFPKASIVTPCGHVFCESCIEEVSKCAVCTETFNKGSLIRIYPSFATIC
uniref:Putative AMP-dependent synthetase and ligase n=1 Tax=Moniliophthora roreri TaxID=221103 RepID=A0A0W0FS65_MONRR